MQQKSSVLPNPGIESPGVKYCPTGAAEAGPDASHDDISAPLRFVSFVFSWLKLPQTLLTLVRNHLWNLRNLWISGWRRPCRFPVVLIAVAGLVACALAGPSADLATPTRKHVEPGQALDPAPSVPMQANGTALPNGLDVNKIIQQVQRGPKPEPLPELDASPFTDTAFMPTPNGVPQSCAGNQGYASAAFDGTNYLVVWSQAYGTSSADIHGVRVAPSGVVLDYAAIVISDAANAQEYPSVAFDGADYFVVWQDYRNSGTTGYDIYGARVSTAGTVINPGGIAISTYSGDQQAPSVTYGGGYFLVAWQDNRNSGATPWDIYGARVSPSGVVQESNGIGISTEGHNQQSPSVAYGGDSYRYMVVWQDYRNGSNWDIWGGWVLTSDGSVTGMSDTISAKSGDQQAPSAAYSTDSSKYLVAWQDNRNSNWDIYCARVVPAGSPLDTNGVKVTDATSAQYAPAVAHSSTRFLVTWQDDRNGSSFDIYGTRVSIMSGMPAPEPVNGVGVSTADNLQEYPAVVGQPTGGKYLAVWHDARNGTTNRDVYASRVRLSGDGLAIDDPGGILITGTVNAQTYSAAAFDGTNYLIVWDEAVNGDTSDIYGARVSKTGSLLDQAGFLITPNTPSSEQACPAVAFDGTNYLVVWQDFRSTSTWDIYGQRVTTGGALAASAITISTAGNHQQQPAVAFDGTNYLVVWKDSSSGNSDIYGARVTKAGAVLDASGRAVSTATGFQQHPAVAFDGANCLVVWQDSRNGNSDIYGARVRRSGSVVTGDADGIVVSVATGFQQCPSVAFDGTNYLVVWQDSVSSGTWNIYGARVSPAGQVQDESGIAIATGAGHQQSPSVAFGGSDHIVVWEDSRNSRYYDIYGCQVSLTGQPGTEYGITAGTNICPAVASGPADGTALATYHSPTNVVGGVDYRNSNRIWARRATLSLDGNVGVDSILRPFASYIVANSWKIPPLAQVSNSGADPRSFKTSFTIAGTGAGYSCTKTVLGLRAAETRMVEFDSLTPTVGAFTVTCETKLGSDGTPGNNVKRALYQGCTFINFFDLTTGGLVAAPDTTWAQGKLQSPWIRPPMDSIVWGDRLSGNYANNENSTLTSPIYKASMANPAIAFQHCFDTEFTRDGGNFSYSTGGDIWGLTPPGGLPYSCWVSALSGLGWSGTSDWKQSVFTIPVFENVTFRVRWRFASDGANTARGWLIDEVAGIGCDTLYHGDGPPQPGDSIVAALDFYPNPVHGAGRLSYTLLRDCNVTIKLYDATGALVERLPTNGFKKGVNTAKMDASKLRHGVYFVMVEGAGDVSSTKVIIQ